MIEPFIDDTNRYFSEKLRIYGTTPAGVDWNSEYSQKLRFEQFIKMVFPNDHSFSICDFGCGYGAFFDYLLKSYPEIKYTGFDINTDMINAAKSIHQNDGAKSQWNTVLEKGIQFDYMVASGVFNLKLNVEEDVWIQHIMKSLKTIHLNSQKAFAFNVLTSYSDRDKMKDYLFYADPCFWFDFCKREFSKNVALLHDYDLYEFTLIVRK